MSWWKRGKKALASGKVLAGRKTIQGFVGGLLYCNSIEAVSTRPLECAAAVALLIQFLFEFFSFSTGRMVESLGSRKRSSFWIPKGFQWHVFDSAIGRLQLVEQFGLRAGLVL